MTLRDERWRCLVSGCNPVLNVDTAQAHKASTGHRVAKWPVRSAEGERRGVVLRSLIDTGYDVVFCTGRKEQYREVTEEWLESHLGFHTPLLMRADDDGRTDWIVKYELFNKHIREQYNVRGVFDDRQQVVKMWRALGLTCFQVAEGDF